MDCSLPGFSVHGIFQARMLEWVAISLHRGSSRPRDRIPVSCISRRILYHRAIRKPTASARKLQTGFVCCPGKNRSHLGCRKEGWGPKSPLESEGHSHSSSPAAFLWRPLQGADGTAQVVCTELVHRAGWGLRDSNKWLVFRHLDNPSPPIISTGGLSFGFFPISSQR